MLTKEELGMLGGSDAAAVAGIHPNKSPVDVFRRVVEGFQEPETAPMRRGTLMEPVIREMARHEYGLELLGPRKLRDPKRPFLRASLDDVAKASDGEEVVEFKSVSPWAAGDYGEGGDEVPGHHLCQVQFYLGMSGLPRARLIALIGVDDLRTYTIEADAEVQGMLFQASERFYRDHILTGRPPLPDGSDGCASWLKSRYPEDKSPVLAATPEAEEWAKRLFSAKASAAQAEELEREARNQLVSIIGEAAGVKGNGWSISYKRTKGTRKTEWQALAVALGATPADIAEHTEQKNGFRVFRAVGPKEKKP